MWTKFPADFVTSTEEIPNGELHFSCIVDVNPVRVQHPWFTSTISVNQLSGFYMMESFHQILIAHKWMSTSYYYYYKTETSCTR